jgi:tetratricopeptide (TPR) repeat protein
MKVRLNIIAVSLLALVPISAAFAGTDATSKTKQQLTADTAAITKAPTASNYGVRAGTYLDLKMYKEALKDLDQAIKLDPTGAIYHGTRAAVLNELGRYKDAIAACSYAMKLSKPGQGEYNNALEVRSTAYLKLGDNKHAKADDAELKRLGVPE